MRQSFFNNKKWTTTYYKFITWKQLPMTWSEITNKQQLDVSAARADVSTVNSVRKLFSFHPMGVRRPLGI